MKLTVYSTFDEIMALPAQQLMLPLLILLLSVAITHSDHESNGCVNQSSLHLVPGIIHKSHINVQDPNFEVIRRSYHILLPVDYISSVPHKLLFDFHGLTMNSEEEVHGSNTIMLSERKVILIWPNGSNDSKNKVRCWNAVGCDHDTGGSMGDTCDRNRTRWGEYEVYASCVQLHGEYSASNTCYCSSCWNDVLFIDKLIHDLQSTLCIDLSHIHATGISAGGQFTYQIGQSLSHIFASVIPVEGSILIGFNNIKPKHPISLLDFRGIEDTEMPANISNSYGGLIGPHNSTWSEDGFWYAPIDNITRVWASGVNACDSEWRHYPTIYDGMKQFYCVSPHGKCANGVDVVRCSGHWDHTWPLYHEPEAYPNLVYDFMVNHPKQEVVWPSRF